MLTCLAGALAANAVPHFVKGVTKEPFPTVFGPSPVVNVVAGWAGFVLAGLLVHWADVGQHPVASSAAGAGGALALALFHAWHGAFGLERPGGVGFRPPR